MRPSLAIAAGLLLVLAACQPPKASIGIGPAGGVLSSGSAQVNVPPGAVSSAQVLSIGPSDPPIPAPADMEQEGEVYALTPHGTTFAVPVTVTLPAPTDPTDLVVLYLNNPQDTVWKEVPSVAFTRGTAQFPVSHFSYYGVFHRLHSCADHHGGCDPNATCAVVNKEVVCTCQPGYTGDGTTCQDIDECTQNPCDAHATCTNTQGSYTCACDGGWSGDGLICTDVDECATGAASCGSNATCTNTPGSYTCACDPGYTEDGGTCVDVDECASGTACDPHATCTNLPGSYSCACDPGYAGDGQSCLDEDECASGIATCDPHATCANTPPGSYTCACNPGYNGNGFSCTDVDECQSGTAQCSANAACTNTPGSYTCTCNAGYMGDGLSCTDVDECANHTATCDPQATCMNTVGSYTCSCKAGYFGNGLTCTDINECATNNGGCGSNATCTNTPGSYTCSCSSGYSYQGGSCQEINPCATNNGGCGSNATCTSTGVSFYCTCNLGYSSSGPTCTDINECAVDNGGCDPNATCLNTPGSYTCTCNSGYIGDGFNCQVPDACATNNGGCSPNATCVSGPHGAVCTCEPGFTGTGVTCTDINECATNNGGCGTGVTCTNTPGSYTCSCSSGYAYSGGSCTDINECATNNGGCGMGVTCTNTVGSFYCSCDQQTHFLDGTACMQLSWSDDAGTSSNDAAVDVAVDGQSNVYVVGRTLGGLDGYHNAGQNDVFLQKYNSAGLKLWTRLAGTSGDEQPTGIAVDASGNVYVSGSTSGAFTGQTSAGGLDMFVLQYDTNGNPGCIKQMGTSSDDVANGIAVDTGGNVYVTGATSGNFDLWQAQGAKDLFVVKFDPTGKEVWSALLGGSGNDVGRGIAVDASGNVFVAGIENDGTTPFPGLAMASGYDSSDYYDSPILVKLNATGTLAWTRLGINQCDTNINTGTCGSPRTRGDDGLRVVVDGAGNSYLAMNSFFVPNSNIYAGHTQMAIARFDTSGKRIWSQFFGPMNETDISSAATSVYYPNTTVGGLALEPAGNLILWGTTDQWGSIYATGTYTPPPSAAAPPYTVGGAIRYRINLQGNVVDAVQIQSDVMSGGSRLASDLTANGLAVDSAGHEYAAGTFTQGTFEGTASAGGSDAVIVRIQ